MPKAGMHPEDLLATLRDAGLRRAQAERDRAEAMHDIAVTVPLALDAGLTKKAIAAATGLTRPTIDALLRR